MKDSWILVGVRHPWWVVITGVLMMMVCAAGLRGLQKDTRADAFLAPDNPALVYKDKVREIFGLSDPLVVAIEASTEQGVYHPAVLQLISELTEQLNELEMINAERTVSLATEDNIVGSAEGMEVAPFYDLLAQGGGSDIRQALDNFPLYQGMLVARDGRMTVIAMELYDDGQAEQAYRAVEAVIAQQTLPDATQIHLAGEGAVLGFLGHYIDRDASRLNPLAGLIITIMLVVAFRRFSPALLGNVIIAAAVLMTLGLMSYAGVSFFVITNAMPVILIGMAVADSIHIFSHYYQLQVEHPQWDKKRCVEQAVVTMVRPVTLTTLTTMAGFWGLYASSYMPPFEYFGLFTALGVFIAWYYSLAVLPAFLVIFKPSVSRRWVQRTNADDVFSRMVATLGKISLARPAITVSIFALFAIIAAMLATGVRVNENRINTFHPSEAIYQADQTINSHMDGTNTLNIIVSAAAPEGLFDPQALHKIASLQRYAESLPHVNGSSSIVDYIKQMNKALHEDRASEYRLPNSAEQIAQYFLLYASSGDPASLEEEIDYDYRLANIRLNLDTASFVATRPVIEALQAYISQHFNSDQLQANLSGRIHVNYHWIKDLGPSHALSVLISLGCVLLVSALLFRSLAAGVLATLPVIFSIVTVYAAMAWWQIDLGIGTSMFAAVAIGLGIDFAIHTLERLQKLMQQHHSEDSAFAELYRSTGRALLFNYLAIALGFGVLISSQVVPLTYFGSIVVVSVSMSFVAALTLLPALVKWLRPNIIYSGQVEPNAFGAPMYGWVLIALILMVTATPSDVQAQPLTADDIAQRVNAVDDGQQVTSQLLMTLTDSRGKQRQRQTTTVRKYFGDDKKTLFLFNSPTSVRGTGFLTFDYADYDRDDDQWLYLPALRKVRRISSSDRGDYFMGTDFTYEDIKQNGRISLEDYQLSISGTDAELIHLSAAAKNKEIADELGYGRVIFTVRRDHWLVIKAQYFDPKDKLLKTTLFEDIRQVDGIWTRHRLVCDNHLSGHRSVFDFSNVDYQAEVSDGLFTKQRLRRGL
jgi:predicted RND superfamily exporter protein